MSRNRKVYGSEELPHRAVAVYLHLQDHADKYGVCYPEIKTIARELKISPRTVQRAINDLISLGFLAREYCRREKNQGHRLQSYIPSARGRVRLDAVIGGA